MSIGNDKTQGNKGNNFPFQFRNLQLLGQILDAVAGLPPAGGLATEATLQNVLTALQSEQEFEQNLVTDTGGVGCPGNCPTYLMVRIWNTVTHTFDPPIYYNASGVVVVPVGPVVLVNPQFVLDGILAQVTAINTDLDVALSTRASEATLAALDSKFTSVVRTPSMMRVVGAGPATVTAGKRRVNFFNAGMADANVLGVVLKQGEVVTFIADGEDDVLDVISYDALTSELLITSVT